MLQRLFSLQTGGFLAIYSLLWFVCMLYVSDKKVGKREGTDLTVRVALHIVPRPEKS